MIKDILRHAVLSALLLPGLGGAAQAQTLLSPIWSGRSSCPSRGGSLASR